MRDGIYFFARELREGKESDTLGGLRWRAKFSPRKEPVVATTPDGGVKD